MRKSAKWLLVLLGIAAIGAAGIGHFQQKIGLSLFERAVNERVASELVIDPLALVMTTRKREL